MTTYFVEMHDYDKDEVIGYFTEQEAAQTCCDYMNLCYASPYDVTWIVTKYNKNNSDYQTLLDAKLHKLQEEHLANLAKTQAAEIELYKQLKAKYGDIEV